MRGRPVGAWLLGSSESGRAYSSVDLAAAQILARAASVALENALIHEESQATRDAAVRAADLSARLGAITAALSEAITQVDVAGAVVEEGLAALDASAGFVALLVDGGRTLEVSRSIGDMRWTAGTRFPVDAPLPSAEAVRTGRLTLIRSMEERAQRFPRLDAASLEGGGDSDDGSRDRGGAGQRRGQAKEQMAWAAIPLLVHSRALGVMALCFDTPRDFSEPDCAFMLTLGRQCAQAIDRARLYEAERTARWAAERAAARTARLQAITVELSGALTPAEVSAVTLSGCIEALGASAGAISLLTEDGRSLEIMQSTGAASGHPGRSTLLPLDAPQPIAEAVRTGSPVWLDSPEAFEAHYASPPGGRGAWAGVPLLVNNRVIGGLGLSFADARRFDEEDRDLITTLARQCTLALERACLFDAERMARQQIAFLADANVLLASIAEQDEALLKLARFAVPFLADMCAIDVIERDGSLVRVGAAHVDPAVVAGDRGRALIDRAARPAIFRVVDGERPLIIEEASGGPSALAIGSEIFGDSGAPASTQPRPTARSAMLVPLLFEGRTLGVISLGSLRRRFGAGDLAVAEPLARRAAVAIDRARLLREAKEAREAAEQATLRISHLQAITAAASQALTPKLLAEAVIALAMAPVGACAGSFGQLSEDGASIELMGLTGYAHDEVDPSMRIPIATTAPMTDAVREGEPIFLENAAEATLRYPRLQSIHKPHGYGPLAVIPLLDEGRAIGALGLVFPESRALTGDDRAFMITLARHCAQALARARSYEAERRAHEAADEANRLKDEFLATISHELRTPLTAILGWARMLRTMKTTETVTNRALESIERNAALQARLIEDLLDASRIITGKLRLEVHDVDLSVVISAAIDAVSHAAHAKDIHLRPEIDPGACVIQGDASRLQQIVWNLLSNAIKFTPQGGVIEIRLDRVGADARIRVIDSGLGIAREFLPYVFDRFRQADSATTRKHGGLGLGLAIVRSLIDMHGGTVQAESAGEGKGATFIVKLPLPVSRRTTSPPPMVAALAPDEELIGLPAIVGLRVLVVDDEPDSREVLSTALESRGAVVTVASSCREALAAVERVRPDVIVSDIAMPDEDGYELIRRLRLLDPARGGRTAAVALTAYARVEDRVRALSAGYQIHVPKPITPAELVAIVASLGADALAARGGSGAGS